MNKKNLSRGVLLVNLGTPDAPTQKSVRKYLKEFLSDKRIFDIAWIFRFLLLYLIILPIRSKKSANLYKKIWTKNGSPLLYWALQTKKLLQQELSDDYTVSIGMRYGSPSIQDGLNKLLEKNVSTIKIIPLFPQYSSSTTGSVIEKASDLLNKNWLIPPYQFVDSFFQNKYFIEAQKKRLLSVYKNRCPDFILFSYHGLPIRHLEKSKENYFKGHRQHFCKDTPCLKDQNCCEIFNETNHFCYRAQCFETTRLIIEASSLPNLQYATTFQSRFGKGQWTTPDTFAILETLRQKNIKTLAVICPGFVADCLETLEEMDIRLKEKWLRLGGHELVLVESLNNNQTWIKCLKDLI